VGNRFRKAAVFAAVAIAVRARAETVFYEEGGIVVVEAESARPKSGWQADTRLEGYTGTCYYVCTGGGKLTYRIVITTAGIYNLRIRNRHDFAQADRQNDCWTSMDGARQLRTYSSTRGVWTWTTRRQDGELHVDPTYELDAGMHVFEITGRSRGFMIDRFHLYRDDVATPTSKALPESTGGMPEMPEIKKLKQLAAYWRRGMLGAALKLAEKQVDSSRPEAAMEAREVVNALKGFADGRRQKLVEIRPTLPVAAAELLMELGKQFMPSETGKEFMAEARRWSQDPATVKALQARRIFDAVRKAAERLEGQGHAKDPAFARRYAREIQTIAAGVKELKAKHSGTAFCAKANTIAIKFGITVE
jgi:hypothetical protein